MPLYWDAYLADTTHLSTEEHGAYLLLLAAMWRRNGWVPDEDRDNARIIGLTPAKWRKVKERLRPLLIFDGGQITQKKLLEIWQITQGKIEKNRANGSKGGRPKSNKINEEMKANGYADGNPNETIPEPEPEPYNTNANALDGDAVTAALWDRGVRFLVAHGSSERNARSVIGKWRKDAGDQEIYDAFAACKREGIVDPIPWITASLAKPKVDLQKIMQEMIDELTSGGPDQTDDRVPQQEDGAEDDRWQRRGAEGGDSFARPRRDEARAPRQLADVVAGVRGRAARSYEDARLADPERN
jgi:uncharacterized protein YdaU (DUF1376 family)